MGWSLRLGKWFGIEVNLHLTFLLLIGFLALTGFAATRNAGAWRAISVFCWRCFCACCCMSSVMRWRRGATAFPRRILRCWPIGGVARLERMPTDPKQELVVALAGPAVNVVIALALLPIIAVSDAAFFERLFSTNLFLVAFNLIPAFPMDGGRVLRAGLAMKMDYAKATRTAATIGQGFAVLFGLVGLFTNPFLILIAVFIWLGAAGESRVAQTQSRLAGVPVERAMLTQFDTLSPLNSLAVCIASDAGRIAAGISGRRGRAPDRAGDARGSVQRAGAARAAEPRVAGDAPRFRHGRCWPIR